MSSPSDHVTSAIRADDVVVIAMSRKPALLFSYLEAFLGDLERWLREMRIDINVSKNAALIFTRGERRSFSCSASQSTVSTKSVYLQGDP
jgi:hypothetical protein